MPRSSALSSEPAAGIWSLDGERLSLIESFDIGPAIVLVPTETVLLTVVDLPISGRVRRLNVLPFAVEDRIAEPLAAVHMALGAELAPGRYLAGVVSHEVMRRWAGIVAEAGLDRARLVPDALALPVPGPGAWSVDLAGGRAMVRTDDGAGFALPSINLDQAWRLAGEPAILAYGEDPGLAAVTAELEVAPLAERLAAPPLDLRQGPYAPPRASTSPFFRRIALVAGLGLLAHGAIAAADTLALDRLAARRAAETRTLLDQLAPGAMVGDDVAASAADFLPADAAPSQFLPLVGRIANAVAPLAPAVRLADLSFDGRANSATIHVTALDSAGLRRVGDALAAAGLDASAGETKVLPGDATGTFIVQAAR